MITPISLSGVLRYPACCQYSLNCSRVGSSTDRLLSRFASQTKYSWRVRDTSDESAPRRRHFEEEDVAEAGGEAGLDRQRVVAHGWRVQWLRAVGCRLKSHAVTWRPGDETCESATGWQLLPTCKLDSISDYGRFFETGHSRCFSCLSSAFLPALQGDKLAQSCFFVRSNVTCLPGTRCLVSVPTPFSLVTASKLLCDSVTCSILYPVVLTVLRSEPSFSVQRT